MARVTVEDCVEKVPNRFDLVMLAAQRSRDIAAGSPISVDRDNDKNPVVALREIADETIPAETLRDNVIRGLQKYVEMDEPEEEDPIELMAGAAMAELADDVVGLPGSGVDEEGGSEGDEGDAASEEDDVA